MGKNFQNEHRFKMADIINDTHVSMQIPYYKQQRKSRKNLFHGKTERKMNVAGKYIHLHKLNVKKKQKEKYYLLVILTKLNSIYKRDVKKKNVWSANIFFLSST